MAPDWRRCLARAPSLRRRNCRWGGLAGLLSPALKDTFPGNGDARIPYLYEVSDAGERFGVSRGFEEQRCALTQR
jgi:hypothetical protein